ncbi:unnamed protein product, partial [Polarella glacialis]
LAAYRSRSNSKVDDLFVGLFKSVVRCPEPSCGRTSVTFDPFLSAKLGLSSSAEERQTNFSVTLVRNVPQQGSSSPVGKGSEQVKVKVNKDAGVKVLMEAAAKEVGDGLEADKCILVEVWNKKVHKFFEDSESVESVRSEDHLILFEVTEPKAFHISTDQRWGASASSSYSPFSSSAFCGTADTAGVSSESSPSSSSSCGVIFHHRQVPSTRSSSSWSYSSRELHGLPLLFSIPRDASARTLYKEVDRRIRAMVLEPESGEAPGWKIYRVDKHSPQNEGVLIDAESEASLDVK